MSDKVRAIFVILGQVIDYLYCLLSLLRLIFKAYLDLTPFYFSFIIISLL